MSVHPENTASPVPAGTGEMVLSGAFFRLLAALSAVLIASVLLRLIVQDPGPGALFRHLLIGVFVMSTILGFITLWLRRLLQQKIISPLETIAAANRRFSEGDLQATLEKLPDGTPREILEIASSREAMLRMIMEISEERLRLVGFIKKAFGLYLSDPIADEILSSPNGPAVSGRRENVTILMADLRGFTAMSEDRDPAEMVHLLNRYLARMSEIIVSYNGIIDEIIGDAILAVFGIGDAKEDHAQRATACAIDMQNALPAVSDEIAADGYPPLEMGIGINTGTVTVGSIGSEIRMKYGVVGTPVNTAARIEANTFGGQILVGEETRRAAGDALRVMPPRSAMVKGLKAPLVFYSVAGIAPPWDRTLKTVPPDENGSAIRLPFYYWKMKEKTVISGSSYGETRRIGENWIEADLEEPVAPFENIRLRFEFCVDAHCFEYIDARGLPAEEEGGTAYRLGITAMDPKDRGVLKKWLRETKH